MKISVAIATYNEEKNIKRCLDSVKDWVNEIIVFDESSTDKTREIAIKLDAKVFKVKHEPIFHITKQKAIDKCTGDWILQLDADEVVSINLAKEIQKIIKLSPEELKSREINSSKQNLFTRHQKLLEERDGQLGTKSGEIVAFFVPRLNYFLGGYLKHAGAYPDGVIRLFKKGKARLPCKSVHEQMEIDGQVGWLENDLIHYADYSFERYLGRSNRYTSLSAQELLDQGIKPSLWQFLKACFNAKKTFLLLFFRHKGFMDGFPGFVFSLYSGIHHITAYIKFTEKYGKL